MTTFRRFVPIERRGLKAVPSKRMDGDDDTDDTLPEIHGTAAVYFDENDRAGTQYGLWDGHVERIQPGAFAGIDDDDVRALQNHLSHMLLGRNGSGTLRLIDRDHGLDYEVATPDTGPGRDTLVSLGRGDMTGSSFQFMPRANGYEWTEEEHEIEGSTFTLYVRNLTDLETFDVGPVTFPAYTGTSSGVGGRSALCLSNCRSDHAQSELTSLRNEVEEFINANNYASEAAAKLEELEFRTRLAMLPQ